MGGFSFRDKNRGPTKHLSAKDLASHTKLKFRGQNAPQDIKDAEIKKKLAEAEAEYLSRKGVARPTNGTTTNLNEEEEGEQCEESEEGDNAPEADIAQILAEQDADETDDSESEESDSDDGSDDETNQLLLELEKIKQERALEQEKQQAANIQEEQAKLEEEALQANPLLKPNERISVKRRWDDDVIFKNQAKSINDKPQKRFINDLIRTDFHRKFMSKCNFIEFWLIVADVK